MSQFVGRTIASAATSFASKRSYAQNIRLPSTTIPTSSTVGSYSNPSSPSAALFSLYGAHARSPSQSQVPFAGHPSLPAGISPASQPQISFWTTSPPRSPSQLQFRLGQQPVSPSQAQFSMNNLAAFTPAQAQSMFDLGFGLANAAVVESSSPAFTGSPAASSRSISPVSFDASQPSGASFLSFQPPPPPSAPTGLGFARKQKQRGAEQGKDVKKGLNPFTYYRKTFPARYPYIDAVIPTQMERSRLTGAFWQNESSQVRAQCEAAVYVDRTPAQIERLENIRLQTQEKRKAERAKLGTDRLEGRNAIIFDLWCNGATPEQFREAIEAHDREFPLPQPARKRRRKETSSRLDADLLLAAEAFSIASSSPQPSISSLTHSPAASFNPELPSAVIDKQENWRPLLNMIAQSGQDQSMPETVTVSYSDISHAASGATVPFTPEIQTQLRAATLYDSFMPPFTLGSDGNMDAILDAYSFVVPTQQHTFFQDDITIDTDDFNFTLPTEEDGLAFDVAYFGSLSHPALDA